MTDLYPAFTPYALFATLSSLLLLVTWNGSGFARARSKTTPNPEDLGTFGPELTVTREDPDAVGRWRRVHTNATATVVPFLFLGMLYVLLGGSALAGWILFGTFTALRVAHAFVYLMRLQPWRTVSYGLSQLALLTLVGLILHILW